MIKGKIRDEETINAEDAYNHSQNNYHDADLFLKNKNFVQYYDGSNDKMLQLTLKEPSTAAVFMFLARFAENNNTIKVGKSQIGEVLKKSESTVKRAIKRLVELNFMTIIKDGRDNIYFLNPMVVCNTKAEYKSTLLHEYMKIAGSTLVNDADETIIDTKKYLAFISRKKQIYKFALKGKKGDLQTDEFIRDFEGFTEYREEQKRKKRQEELDAIDDGLSMTDEEFEQMAKEYSATL